jgi:hypothetical protein
MKLRIIRFWNIKLFLIVTGCIALVAAAVSYFAGMNFWLMFVICFMAMWLNSLLLQFEDKLPGGFLNPIKKQSDTEMKEK